MQTVPPSPWPRGPGRPVPGSRLGGGVYFDRLAGRVIINYNASPLLRLQLMAMLVKAPCPDGPARLDSTGSGKSRGTEFEFEGNILERGRPPTAGAAFAQLIRSESVHARSQNGKLAGLPKLGSRSESWPIQLPVWAPKLIESHDHMHMTVVGADQRWLKAGPR